MSLLDLVFLTRKKARTEVQHSEDLAKNRYRFRLRFQSTADYFEQSPRPEGSDPSNLMSRLKGGFKVKLKKGTKKITLFRFLLAKMLYEAEDSGLHLDEFIVLTTVYYNFFEETDPSFIKKYGNDLERLLPFFQNIGEAKEFPLRLELDEELKTKLIEWIGPLLPTPHSYYGLRGNRDLRKSYSISFNDTIEPTKIRTPRYVGVGYRDKGTCRNSAIDGSPSWKEVGSEAAALERCSEELGLFNLEENDSR